MRPLPCSNSASMLLPLSIATLLIACGAHVGTEDETLGESSQDVRTTYGEFIDTLDVVDSNRWHDVRRALVKGFEDTCGDTFCEGDFGNWRTVRLTCASTHKTKKMTGCAWVFADNIDYVSAATGSFATDARLFACPVVTGSNANDFLDALSSSPAPLRTTLPGTSKSFFENIADCFARGVGAAHPPTSSGSAFESLDARVAASVVVTDDAMWRAAQAKLREGFNDVCGDTFCEGDYADIEALRISCAVDNDTDRLAGCQWTFAMADTHVTSRGKLAVTSETRTCAIPVNAKVTDFLTALAVSDPLDAPLPGGAPAIYESLIDCL